MVRNDVRPATHRLTVALRVPPRYTDGERDSAAPVIAVSMARYWECPVVCGASAFYRGAEDRRLHESSSGMVATDGLIFILAT